MSARTAICTWFVADAPADATFFPQVGARSDSPSAQAVYWRCSTGFFASSLAVNPDTRHLLFTNGPVPHVDGVDLAALYARWGVETVLLPVAHRLPRGAVGSWGNQFYVFDILDHLAADASLDRAIVLDSDCLWLRPVDEMERAIDQAGALTYLLGEDAYREDEPINGLTRGQMARFLHTGGGPDRPSTPYYGGEIYAATRAVTARLAARAAALWPAVLAQGADAPREEAHFLSVLYALEGIAPGTADRFIRRMWTAFHHHDLRASDRELTIWHLPVEKRTGFAELFAALVRHPGDPRRDAAAMGLTYRDYARAMGYPSRRPAKLARDLSAKLREKLA
ncbi:MAG: hypothetical protein ABW194_11745 [Novosphingobium sp.]